VSGAASSLSSDSAEITGTVNANDIATQAFFQFSSLPDFATLDGTTAAGEVAGAETTTLSANVAGLAAGATYYWRLAATNAVGTSVGDTQSFTTPVFATKTSRASNALRTSRKITGPVHGEQQNQTSYLHPSWHLSSKNRHHPSWRYHHWCIQLGSEIAE
jgi:hypothetical protein